MKQTGTCSICEGTYTNYGNNPWPFDDGRACHDCNNRFVTPARILKVTEPFDLALLAAVARLGRQMTWAASEAATLVPVDAEPGDKAAQ